MSKIDLYEGRVLSMSAARFGVTGFLNRNTDQPTTKAAGNDTSGAEVMGHGEHRDITGGAARAAVFGVSDGLVTNISLILGVAGAHPSGGFVRLAGLAGLVAGSFSMALGEYVSMRAQRELFEREITIEAEEIAKRPESETRELSRLYESRGVPRDLADQISKILMSDPKVALSIHSMEELGVHPDSIGSPIQAAVSSFLAFALGAIIPLFAWFFLAGSTAVWISIGVSFVASVLVGGALAVFTGRSIFKSAARQVLLSSLAAGVTYLVGMLVGHTA